VSIYVSSWFAYRGAGRVGISRGLPRGVPGDCKRYIPLAPGRWFLTTNDYHAYRSRYFAQLKELDPHRVIADLHRLAGYDQSPVLLCFCRLDRAGSWCHRTMAAEWLCENTGIEVKELEPEYVQQGRAQLDLR